ECFGLSGCGDRHHSWSWRCRW
ncbi:hypothetical protein AZZ99_001697, partial [Serratia marcescens]